ncbi:MAG: hypothetical protein ACLS5G_07025 [Streptococcus sp.]
MVPTYDGKYQANSEQTLAILPHTKIYLMAFYPANLHLPWQNKASISG